jgi:hypothetical protein
VGHAAKYFGRKKSLELEKIGKGKEQQRALCATTDAMSHEP